MDIPGIVFVSRVSKNSTQEDIQSNKNWQQLSTDTFQKKNMNPNI